TKAIAVRFVAQLSDALDLLLAMQFADVGDHGRLVNLVGEFRDDDRFAVLADGTDRNLAAHHDRTAAKMIGRTDALAPEYDAAGREIRSRDDVDEFVDGKRGVVDQCRAGVDDLDEIVRRNIGRRGDDIYRSRRRRRART